MCLLDPSQLNTLVDIRRVAHVTVVADSHLYHKISGTQMSDRYEKYIFRNVEKATRKMCIFGQELLILPINVRNFHWSSPPLSLSLGLIMSCAQLRFWDYGTVFGWANLEGRVNLGPYVYTLTCIRNSKTVNSKPWCLHHEPLTANMTSQLKTLLPKQSTSH